jgi:Tfp pilus assembly protein PilV
MHTSRRTDAGDSLVEILAAVAVLSIGVVALVTALAAMTKSTVSNRGQARAETTLLTAAEYVKTMSLSSNDFASCGPSPAPLTSAQIDLPTGFTAAFGKGSALGATPCSKLVAIPVTVTGDGYNLTVNVVRRA